jgi:mono/diheme cytochrome c family protein
MMRMMRSELIGLLILLATAAGYATAAPAALEPFLQKHCAECHDAETQKGDLDLTALKFDLADQKTFAKWVTVYDRVNSGEMPPKKKTRPAAGELAGFEKALSGSLTAADDERAARDGRATQRRLNRYEYENVLRDLLHAPWLQIRDALPEDGEASRLNKIGDALDVSHVQMARYLSVAEYALRQVTATQVQRPPTRTVRYYTRDQRSFSGKMKFSVFNTRPERATFPVLGTQAQPDVRSGKAPMTVGPADQQKREEEAVGVVASTYEPIEIKFNGFEAPSAGHYKLRFKTYTVWVGPGKGDKWFIPDFDTVSPGRRSEPITIYSETPPRLLRRLGAFDATIEPGVAELDVYLLAGETIRPDAARLFRSRPPNWHNPLAEADGCPGVAFAWMEVQGPLLDEWPPAGHRVLFGDLPLKKPAGAAEATVVSSNAKADAERLLRNFMAKAYRGPVADAEVKRFLAVIEGALASGSAFEDAMIAGYTGVLCSPRLICLEETPGRLDDQALASRLSFFLWNTAPDDELRALAAKGELHRPEVLRAQTNRLINDPRSRQFVDAFLDYWLDLRKITSTAPDGTLYNDYYLDDLLVESALEETQSFFSELLRGDLPSRNVIASDFAMLNERLADHYGIPGVEGVAIRRVKLPADSVRGGLMTQASVLKVTANGTTTSPVIRGAWIMERVLGKPPPPPPASVPAVDPDTRGATTIREQLAKHRTQQTCAACHAKMDPAGFALESFDVMGGWRDRYRALGDGAPEKGIGKNGQRFTFHPGPPVDCSGELPDGRRFTDVRELKKMLLSDERQVARNLARQLIVYATGAPVRFGDRAKVEAILDRTAPRQFGVRSLVHEIVQSELFRNK